MWLRSQSPKRGRSGGLDRDWGAARIPLLGTLMLTLGSSVQVAKDSDIKQISSSHWLPPPRAQAPGEHSTNLSCMDTRQGITLSPSVLAGRGRGNLWETQHSPQLPLRGPESSCSAGALYLLHRAEPQLDGGRMKSAASASQGERQHHPGPPAAQLRGVEARPGPRPHPWHGQGPCLVGGGEGQAGARAGRNPPGSLRRCGNVGWATGHF